MDYKNASIFKLFVQNHKYNYFQPWESSVQNSSGTGFCIMIEKQKVIVTNNHVIENAFNIYAEDEKLTVLYEDKSSDLAILTCPHYAEPLELGEVASGNHIYIQGFPGPLRGINITEGIISKLSKIDHGLVKHLAFEVTALINAGNSGGPAFFEGKVIGVAYLGIDDLNTYFVIPYFILAFAIKKYLHKFFYKYYEFDWQILNTLLLQTLTNKKFEKEIVLHGKINGDSPGNKNIKGLLIDRKFLASHIEGIEILKEGQIRLSDFLKYLGFKPLGEEKITFKYLIPFVDKSHVTFSCDSNSELYKIKFDASLSLFESERKKDKESEKERKKDKKSESGKKDKERGKNNEKNYKCSIYDININFNPPQWIIFGGWVFVPVSKGYNSTHQTHLPSNFVVISEILENEYNYFNVKYRYRLLDITWDKFIDEMDKLKKGKIVKIPLYYEKYIDICIDPEEKKYTDSTWKTLFD